MSAFSGIASFLVNYAQTVSVGLATANTQLDWSDERQTQGGAGYSASISLTSSTPQTLDLASLVPATTGGVVAYAFKVKSGATGSTTTISTAAISAALKVGGSFCVAAVSPGHPKSDHISISTTSTTALVIEVVVLLAPSA
jgi:hypothetical protein